MDTKLFNAILSMDSYNRGYSSAIELIGTKIGVATIVRDSSILKDAGGNRLDQAASFYAIAYEMPKDVKWGGRTIVAYRGTDAGEDAAAYPIATGSTGTTQGRMAFEFYNAVATAQNSGISIDPRLANISLTGHSLGGGLAGLVGANDNYCTIKSQAA